jgi:hypothetical protein
MSTTTTVPSVTSRMVEEKGLLLPYVIPAVPERYPGMGGERDEKTGEVFVPLTVLYKIVDKTLEDGFESLNGYVNLPETIGFALLALGWVRRTTGGSWAGTKALYTWGEDVHW